jgi:hypothetical protein
VREGEREREREIERFASKVADTKHIPFKQPSYYT